MADRAALRSEDSGQRERGDTRQLCRGGHSFQVSPRRVLVRDRAGQLAHHFSF